MKLKAQTVLFGVIACVILFDLSTRFDLPVFRQVIGFFVLSLLPGGLIVALLRLKDVGFLEKAVLAFGTSIALMLAGGLVYNQVFLLVLGVSTPLSPRLLIDVVDLLIIGLALAWYWQNAGQEIQVQVPRLTPADKVLLIPAALLPALIIVGMDLMNTTGDHRMLIAVLIAVPVLAGVVASARARLSRGIFPVMILSLSISLLLMLALRSNHIIGTDSHMEYYTFMMTLENAHWSVVGSAQLDSCLSTSILPAVYHLLLNPPPEMLFKVLFCLIFSVAPLVVYLISSRYFEEVYAFLAAVFFMFQAQFLSTASNARTFIAILFLALTLMVLLSREIPPLKARVFLYLFIAGAVFSHYSTSFLFFFILLLARIGTQVLAVRYPLRPSPPLDVLAYFFGLMYLWYALVTVVPAEMFVDFIHKTVDSSGYFLDPTARGDDVQKLFGSAAVEKGGPYRVQLMLTWATLGYIGMGLLSLLARFRENVADQKRCIRTSIEKRPAGGLFITLVIISFLILGLMIVMPYVSAGYEVSRVFPVSNILLSVLFVAGGLAISRVLMVCSSGRRRVQARYALSPYYRFQASLVILLILMVPYFYSVSGVVHTVSGDHRDLLFHDEGPQYEMKYVHDSESSSAQWLKEHMDPELKVFSDGCGVSRLMSQGPMNHRDVSSFIQYGWVPKKSYVYFRYLSVVDGDLIDYDGISRPVSEYTYIFEKKHKILSNGGSSVWG
ncbi:putative membrane protein [Methanofollis sp. W23]|uniref:DUF2206 domain-containing protein n=1 Tax=Methanofollis sp. W23 TaxID=2817849 RepID=UPI001AEA8F53|nr:DUF2206 domain-containing protein [Methanofollis sp. W23]MBP2144590.1 putative membrane protein [Methanofollis sp. W23]